MSDTPIIPSQNSLLGQLVEVLPFKHHKGHANNVGKRGVIVSSWVHTYQSDTENHRLERNMPSARTSRTSYKSATLVQLKYGDGGFSSSLHLSHLKVVTEIEARNKSEKGQHDERSNTGN